MCSGVFVLINHHEFSFLPVCAVSLVWSFGSRGNEPRDILTFQVAKQLFNETSTESKGHPVSLAS